MESTATYRYTGTYIRPSGYAVRRVWRAVSQKPCASRQALSHTTGLCLNSVSACLYVLRANGILSFDSKEQAARRVLIPFGWQWMGD